MPRIKIDHIISFSSEDSVHTASNLLTNDPTKKWKCAAAGEKTATVVLQLEKASVISAIDVGNEYSAYIEILAARSGMGDDYKVLLVMSSFMKPLEARQGTNVNAVRMFTADQLSQPECHQKWDRVKVVCTQPFNRHVQYGLSFISFHSPEDKPTTTSDPAPTIGKFTLRPKSPDDITVGNLFARRREQKEDTSVATAIRAASSSQSPLQRPKIDLPKRNNSDPAPFKQAEGSTTKPRHQDRDRDRDRGRGRDELFYGKDEEEPNEKIDKLVQEKEREKIERSAAEEKKTNKTTPKLKKDDGSGKPVPVPGPGAARNEKRKQTDTNSGCRKKVIKLVQPTRPTKPFRRLLEGVTLVISGIQNPDRAGLRAMALEMGAKYKADWDTSTCTHLICAYINTPKFRQVKGRGKIVTRKWIEECHEQRKRLPWRRFCLDRSDSGQESEEEIYEEVLTEIAGRDEDARTGTDIENDELEFMEQPLESDDELEASVPAPAPTPTTVSREASDPFNLDTDTEETDDRVAILEPKFKTFLSDRTFYIDSCFDEEVTRLINKYINAYGGTREDDPTENVHIIVTRAENVEDLKNVNSEAVCIRPDWLWECHNEQRVVPFDGYILT